MSEKYVCTLTEASIKKAKEELNEIPQDRLSAVQALRDWIKQQPHIRCPELALQDTRLMLRYLRGAKFSQLRAREKFEQYLIFKKERSEWRANIDTRDKVIEEILKTGAFVPLPKRTPRGEQIILERFALMGPRKEGFMNMFRCFYIMNEYMIREEESQVNGFVFFNDCTGITSKLMAKLINKDVSNFVKEWLKCSPGRFKKFHYYNAGVIIEAFMTFFRQVLPKKMNDRILMHDNLETLYETVPKHCLPVEYLPDDYTGPNAGRFDDILEHFITKVQAEPFRQSLLFMTGPQFSIDESKRPKETLNQHFRKLNVD